MRRVLAWAVASAIVLAAGACTDDPHRGPAQVLPTALPSGAAATSSPLPANPAVTRQTCTDAIKVAADGTKVFNDQLAVLEKAAAKGDQTTMVAAAEAINRQFVEMATVLGALSKQTVSQPVRAALVDASAALSDIASEAYTGTMADIKKKLTELSTTFTKACA